MTLLLINFIYLLYNQKIMLLASSAILIVVLLVVVFVATRRTQLFERFSSVLLVQDKVRAVIRMPVDDFNPDVVEFVSKMGTKFSILPAADKQADADFLCMDSLSYQLSKKGSTNQIVACTNSKKMCWMMKDASNIDDGAFTTMVKKGSIGYTDDASLRLLRSLCFCYGIEPDPRSTFVKMSSWSEAVTALFEKRTLKSVFVFANPDDPSHQNAYARYNVALYNFDDCDTGKLKVMLPFALVSNYDFRRLFPKYLDRHTVKLTMSFDTLISTSKHNRNSNYLYDYLARYFQNNYDVLNFQRRFFEIHPRTEALLGASRYAEGFSQEEPLVFEMNDAIPGFLKSSAGVFTTPSAHLNGTPVKVGDIVKLKQQKHDVENGVYTVTMTKHDETVLKKTDAYTPKTPAEDDLDPRYTCVTDPSIKIKGLCLSKYDTAGKLKPGGSADVWDRPCDADQDCPYFQKNTRYKNYRGGCTNGYCEMPIGIKRVGHRFFMGKPVCHKCDDPYDADCCSKQADPDYAFALDEYEREEAAAAAEHFHQRYSQERDDALPGDYPGAANPNAYHSELDNRTFQNSLSSVVRAEVNGLLESWDFAASLEPLINECFPQQDQVFKVHDVRVESQEIDDHEQSTYSVQATIYRPYKSHGKRVRVVLKETEGRFYVDKIDVIGVVPEQDVGKLDVCTHGFGTPNSRTADIRAPDFRAPCDHAKKMNLEFNMDVKCV
jgi:hypothetical protein